MRNNTNLDCSPRLIVIGYAQHDINVYPNGTESFCVGGGGYFASIAASRVFSNVALVTRVGGDFDIGLLSSYVLCDAVSVIPAEKTATSVQTYYDLSDLTKRSISLEPGVNPGISAQDIPEPWIQSASVIMISTMFPQQQRAIVDEVIKRKRSTEIRIANTAVSLPIIAVDSDQCWLSEEQSACLVRETMQKADIVFMNRTEGELLQDIVPNVPLLVLKRDREGAELLERGICKLSVPTPTTTVVDVTGAGDILAGTFLAALLTDNNAEQALRMAVEAASLSISQHGIHHMLVDGSLKN